MPDDYARGLDDREEVQRLHASIQMALPRLEQLLERCSGHWGYEDPIYRYYHQSFKVYRLQDTTEAIVVALQDRRAGSGPMDRRPGRRVSGATGWAAIPGEGHE